MASVTIRLIADPRTGKKNVIISYESDADAMPIEHEDDHRRIVDKLIEGGALSASELGTIIVDREESGAVPQQEEQTEAAVLPEGLTEDA